MTPEEEGFQRHLSSEAVISKVVGAIVKQVDAADGNKLGLVINGASAAGNGEHGSFSSAAAESTAKIMEDLRWIIMNYNETRRVGPNSWQGFLFGWFVGGVLKRAVNEVTTTPVYTNFLENESQISRHSFLMQLMLKSSTVKSILEMATHIILSDR